MKYEAALKEKWLEAVLVPEFRYFFGVAGYYHLAAPEIEKDTWNKLQMLSVDSANGGIKGYLEARFNRSANEVGELCIINFEDTPSLTFASDLKRFLEILLSMHLHAIRWSVAVGNRAESIYDDIARKHDGRIVRYEHGYFRLPDGSRCDAKGYEILLGGS